MIYNEPYVTVEVPYSPVAVYANKNSVTQGESIHFHVWIQGVNAHNPAPFTVDIKRIEIGEISVATLNGYSFEQPTNNDPAVNGCGWNSSLEYVVPTDLKSGAYIAYFTAQSYGSASVYFFVKSSHPGIGARILVVASVNTWQAYNEWNDNVGDGKNLYHGTDGKFETRARKVSFNRPPREYEFYTFEVQFIQWFYKSKANNILPSEMEIEFCTSVDLHAEPDLINNYKLIVSLGHDEYWSWEMRDTIERFVRDFNGNVAFLSGNVSWWQVRFEDDELGNPNRILVCYKDYQEDRNANPGIADNHMTINWFEQIIQRPENLMTGVSYYWGTALNGSFTANYKVSLQKHWLLKDSGLVDRQGIGSELFNNAFETDAADFADYDKKFPIPTGKIAFESPTLSAPKDLMILASANITTLGEIEKTYCGPLHHNGWGTIGIYRKRNGGFVFHGGNYNWARAGLGPYVSSNVWNEFCWITKNIVETLGVDFQSQAFLLLNPDFENGNLDSWVKFGAGTASVSSPGHGDSFCALISATGSDTFLFQDYIPIRTNRQYRISCFALPNITTDSLEIIEDTGPGGSGISIRLETLDLDKNPVQEIIIATYPTGGTRWMQISAIGQMSDLVNPDRIVQARVKLYVRNGVSAYFDNVIIEEL